MQKTAFGTSLFSVVALPQPDWGRTITKILLVMKLTAILLTLAFLQVSASGSAQSVTLSGKNITLKEVFSAIKEQTGYVVFYNQNMLSGTKPVSLTVYDMPLRDLLKFVLKEQPVNYIIQDKTIILSRKAGPGNGLEEALIFTPTSPEDSSVSIKGLVQDVEGKPIAGVSVVVKKSSKGTMTSGRGEFAIQANTGDVLIFSYIGYETQDIRINGPIVLVVLKLSPSVLDETQVTAYGKTSRRLSTGNIGTVRGEDIEKQPVLTLHEALIGRVPGINITPLSGNPAGAVQVEIRGRNSLSYSVSSDPLYVIDGIPLSTLNVGFATENQPYSTGALQGGLTNLPTGENPLLSINPKDIESVDILKDADATAIYGSRGANGVILITTKKGKSGPTRFNMSINSGFKSIQKYPKLLNTREYLAVRREAFRNDGIEPNIYNAPDLTVWDTTKYTDWQRLFGGTGNTVSIDAGMSGGIGQTTFGISANFGSNKEIMNNGGKNIRTSVRSSLNHSSKDQKFTITTGNNIALTDVIAYSIGDATDLPPNAPDIYNEKGEFNFEPYRGNNGSFFPFGGLIMPSKSKSFMLQSNIKLSYEIAKGLNVSTTVGYNFTSNENSRLTPSAASDPLDNRAMAFYGNSTNKSWSFDPQISYTNMIGKGKFSAQLIGGTQEVRTRGYTFTGQSYPNDDFMKSINNAMMKTLVEGYKEYKYISASAIINYAWDNKYVINLNGRRDGSSRFGPGKQFGNFGSVGLAWIVSDERWIQEILPSWFSFLKLRGSYGITGSDGIGDYEYLSRWASTYSLTDARVIFKYNGIDAFQITRALNQDFQWSSTKKREAALQLGFWDNKMSLNISYYSNITDNQLIDVPMPVYTGFKKVVGNWAAVVQNSGLELELTANLINSKDWKVAANFNIGTNKNKLIDYPGLSETPYSNQFKIGQSLSTRYLLHYTGIDPLNGTYTFEDRNKDGVINISEGIVPLDPYNDNYIALDLATKYAGGFGTSISYKNLSLRAQFSFVNKLSVDPFLDIVAGKMNNVMLPKEILDNHWKQPGDIAKYPKFTSQSVGSLSYSDAYYVNGAYLRLSSLSLQYPLPEKWIRKIRMKGANLAVQTQNLFTITNYKGFDPVLTGPSPIARTVATSLQFNF